MLLKLEIFLNFDLCYLSTVEIIVFEFSSQDDSSAISLILINVYDSFIRY